MPMTPRIRLPIPRLTLFTGGKECSLCEVAKQDLAKLRRTTPFELNLWNIRDPPKGTDEREAKKWRRLYQYDITNRKTSHRSGEAQQGD
ncbi:hypothetical protein V865_000885 [Kwoniella europaea PYCC6329]|uniref:Glutaredoxin-like protein n=1 Tax=Kwoniella europaea PYCC6329 TaxID=1423913 RepID=A0AAX4KBM4_9TREE